MLFVIAERSDEDYELDIAGLRYGHDFLLACDVGDCEHIAELVNDGGISVDFTGHVRMVSVVAATCPMDDRILFVDDASRRKFE